MQSVLTAFLKFLFFLIPVGIKEFSQIQQWLHQYFLLLFIQVLHQSLNHSVMEFHMVGIGLFSLFCQGYEHHPTVLLTSDSVHISFFHQAVYGNRQGSHGHGQGLCQDVYKRQGMWSRYHSLMRGVFLIKRRKQICILWQKRHWNGFGSLQNANRFRSS